MNKPLKNFIDLWDFEDIWNSLVSVYPNQTKKKGKYRKAYRILSKLRPKTNDSYSKIIFTADENGVYCRVLNKYYTPPPKGREMYSGKVNDEKDVPDNNHYNINCDRYTQHFPVDTPNWAELLGTPFHYKKPDVKKALAIFLYELTYHGYTPKEVEDFFISLNETLLHSHK